MKIPTAEIFVCQKTGCTFLNELLVPFEAQFQLNSIYKHSYYLTENTGSPLQGRNLLILHAAIKTAYKEKHMKIATNHH
jgi:hypothetical protein